MKPSDNKLLFSSFTWHHKLVSYHVLPVKSRILLSIAFTFMMMPVVLMVHLIFRDVLPAGLIVMIYVSFGAIAFLWGFAIIEPRFSKIYHYLIIIVFVLISLFFFFHSFLFSITPDFIMKTQSLRTGEIHTAPVNPVIVILGIMIMVFITIGYTIYSKVIEMQSVAKARIDAEMRIASDLQIEFSSPVRFGNTFITVDGVTVPASEAGGDYVDFIPYGNRYFAVIADVAGHGIGTIVAVGMLKSIIRSLIPITDDLRLILSIINAQFKGYSGKKIFVSMTILKFVPDSMEMQIANAGHIPVLKYDPEKKQTEEIHLKSVAIGLSVNPDFNVKTEKIKSGDRFLLITDGLIESTNLKNDEYGFEKVSQELDVLGDQSSELIIQSIRNDFEKFKSGNQDDYSMMCITVH